MSLAIAPIVKTWRPLTSLMGAMAVISAAFLERGATISGFLLPVALGALIAFMFTSASNTLNDIYDVEIDHSAHPERPLAAGVISPAALKLTVVILFVGSLLLTIAFLTRLSSLIVTIAVVIELVYELGLKAKPLAGNLLISFQTALAFIFGASAVEKVGASMLLALVAFLAILGREIIKSIEDMEADRGRRVTLPIWAGRDTAIQVARFLLLLTMIIGIIPYYPLGLLGAAYLLFMTIGDILIVYSLFVIRASPPAARKTSKYGMVAVLCGFVLGAI